MIWMTFRSALSKGVSWAESWSKMWLSGGTVFQMDGIANVKALKQNQFGMSEDSERLVVAGAQWIKWKDIKYKVREGGPDHAENSRSAVPSRACCHEWKGSIHCTAQNSSHLPHVAVEHLKYGYCNWETEISISINWNVHRHT